MKLSFYQQVAAWVVACLATTVVSMFAIGPLIPPALMIPLWIASLVILIAAAFFKNSRASGIVALAVSAIIGIVLYPSISLYLATGAINVIMSALVGTAGIFTIMAVFGWRTEKNIDRFQPLMFWTVIAIIGVSLVNILFLHLTVLQTIISVVVLIVFTFYIWFDIQQVKRRAGDRPPSFYALSLYLDIVNIFTALLDLFDN